jgi:hypothetical protein
MADHPTQELDQAPRMRSSGIRRPYEPALLEGLPDNLEIRIGAAELLVAELQGSERREKPANESEAMRILAALYLEAGIADDDAASRVKAEQFAAAAKAFYLKKAQQPSTIGEFPSRN